MTVPLEFIFIHNLLYVHANSLKISQVIIVQTLSIIIDKHS